MTKLDRIIKKSVKTSLYEAMSRQDKEQAFNELAYEMFGVSFDEFYKDLGFMSSPIKIEKLTRFFDEVNRRGLLS